MGEMGCFSCNLFVFMGLGRNRGGRGVSRLSVGGRLHLFSSLFDTLAFAHLKTIVRQVSLILRNHLRWGRRRLRAGRVVGPEPAGGGMSG